MPESGLNLSVGELRSEVGVFAGFGPGKAYGDTDWDTARTLRIKRSVKSGIRMVLYTRAAPDIPGGYGWSFMKPKATVLLPAGASSITMPDDFGGLDANVVPASTSGESEFTIAVCGPNEIDRLRSASPNSVGRPRLAEVEPIKETTPGASTRFLMQVFPTADKDYSLQVRYYYLADAFDDDNAYPPGGAAHAETYKAAVRAAYERDFDNIDNGPEWNRFLDQLRASIDYDRKLKPLTMGRNSDRSDGWENYPGWPHVHDPEETMPLVYNGVNY